MVARGRGGGAWVFFFTFFYIFFGIGAELALKKNGADLCRRKVLEIKDKKSILQGKGLIHEYLLLAFCRFNIWRYYARVLR